MTPICPALLTFVSFEHPHAIVPVRRVSTPEDAPNFPWPKRLNHVPRELQCDLVFVFFRSTQEGKENLPAKISHLVGFYVHGILPARQILPARPPFFSWKVPAITVSLLTVRQRVTSAHR